MARDTDITVRLRDRFSQGMSKLGRGVRNLRQRFFNLRTAVVGVVAAMGAFAAARGVTNFLGGAISEARTFEAQMATVRAVTGATAEEFDKLNEAARAAGASTRFTAAEAGAGLEELSRAGFNATESIQALNSVLQFAQANSIAVSEAATQITTSLNQFGLAADQAGRVSDVLTKTAASSATNVTQLGNAMSYAAPLARQAGTSIEETAAIIGSLADQGFRGERAGTALRQAFALLQDPASKTARALDKAGISTRDFTEIIGILERDSAKAKDVLLSLPLEVRPAIAALVQQGSAQIGQLTETLREAGGATAEAAKIMDDNLDGALRSLSSAFSDLKIELVTPLVKALTTEIQGLTERIREFTQSGGVQQLKEDLVEGFRSATRALKNFLSEFDFDAATKRLGDFVRETGQKTDAIIKSVRVFGRTAKGIGAGIRVAFSSIDVAVSRVVETFAFAARKVFELDNAIAERVPGWRKHGEDLAIVMDIERRAAERAEQANIDLGNAIGDLFDAMEPLEQSSKDAAAGIESTGKAGKEAKEGVDQATDSLQKFEVTAKRIPSGAAAVKAAMAGLGTEGQAAAQRQADLTAALEKQNPTLRKSGSEIQTVADQTGVWNKIIKIWKGETKEAGDETEKTADKTRDLGRSSAEAGQQVAASADAYESAKTAAQGVGQAIASIVGRYRELGGTVGDVAQSVISNAGRMTTTITSFFRNMGRDLRRVEDEFARNSQAFDKWRSQLEAGEISASRFVQEIRTLGGEAALLDKQRLDFFRSQIAQARREAADLRREFIQLNNEIERDFLGATGAEAELIRREFDQREAQLRAAFEALGFQEQQAQRQQFRESLKRLKELEKQRLAEVRERNRAEREANEETHRQRESDAVDFHEGEQSRARERGRTNAGAVVDYNRVESEAQDFHQREMQRIAERKQAQIEAEREITEAQRQIAGSGGLLAGGRGGDTGRLEIVHRVLSDALNGQQLNVGEEQLRQITQQVLQKLVSDRMVGGLYGHG